METQTKIQIIMATATKKMKLRAFWEECTVEKRNKILLDVSEKCQNSIQTVRSWMLGYRNPKALDRKALFSYIEENFKVEIIKGGEDDGAK